MKTNNETDKKVQQDIQIKVTDELLLYLTFAQSVLTWVNFHLQKKNLVVTSLHDLHDGVILANLLEILDNLPVKHTPNPKLVSNKLDNLNTCFHVLRNHGIRPFGCTPEGDIYVRSLSSPFLQRYTERKCECNIRAITIDH